MKNIIPYLLFIFLAVSLIVVEFFFRPAFQIRDITKKGNQVEVILKRKNQQLKASFRQDKHPIDFDIGDWVLAEKQTNNQYLIVDIYRGNKLILLFLFLTLAVLVILKRKGVKSLLALFLTYFVLFTSILPNIVSGYNPLVVIIFGILFLIPINFYLAHGVSKKINAAVISSLILIVFAFLMTILVTTWLKISGITEEANFVNFFLSNRINFQHLYISSVVLGIFGSLDDVAITQASIVETLVKEKLEKSKIFSKAIEIGFDHINSIFNTLIIVYTSASFPLLLLYFISKKSFLEASSYEIISLEINRIILATFFTLISVPLTTIIAQKIFEKVN